MVETTTKQPVKEFTREKFETVKKLQGMGWKRARIAKQIKFGETTVRKAMKAPNWPQYRKNEKAALRARKERRDNDFFTSYSKSNNSDEPFLPSPKEGEITKTAGITQPDNTYRNIGIGAAVLIIALVLFWIAR